MRSIRFLTSCRTNQHNLCSPIRLLCSFVSNYQQNLMKCNISQKKLMKRDFSQKNLIKCNIFQKNLMKRNFSEQNLMKRIQYQKNLPFQNQFLKKQSIQSLNPSKIRFFCSTASENWEITPELKKIEAEANTPHPRVEIRRCLEPNKGRGLFALREFSTGDLIFVDRALAVAPASPDFCANCLSSISNQTLVLPSGYRFFASERGRMEMQKHGVKTGKESAYHCPKCKEGLYCSEICQKLDASQHQWGCESFKSPRDPMTMKVAEIFLSKPIHTLIYRLFIKIWNELKDPWNFQDSFIFRYLSSLDHNFTLPETDLQLEEELEVIRYLLPKSTDEDWPPMEQYVMIKKVCEKNSGALSINSPFLTVVGAKGADWKKEDVDHGIYFPLLGALMNHSCKANVHLEQWSKFDLANWTPQGAEPFYWPYRWVAARKIRPGQELTISYLGHIPPAIRSYALRQERLKKQWGFSCNCKLCAKQKKELDASPPIKLSEPDEILKKRKRQ